MRVACASLGPFAKWGGSNTCNFGFDLESLGYWAWVVSGFWASLMEV